VGAAFDRDVRVLIVGGGIAGLSLAAALRGGSFDVTVIERRPDGAPTGGGIAMQPNAMRALRSIGVADAVERAGATIERFSFLDAAGTALCSIDLPSVWGEVGPFVGIDRADLHDVLVRAAGGCGRGVGLRGLACRPGAVTATCSDGSTADYDLVVGADGLHSTVRAAVFAAEAPVYGGQMVWRSVTAGADLDGVQFWLGDGCFFGLCPVGGGRVYGFANVTAPRCRDLLPGRVERLRRHFAGFGAPVQAHLSGIRRDEDVHCAPIEWLAHPHWRCGRVVLIGDAAHAASPMMGQGGAMAIEDAVVLAECLTECLTEEDVDVGLDRFVARRQQRVAWVHEQSRAVGDLIGRPAVVRDAMLRAHGHQAFADRYRPLAATP
jgi:FAD-dependent urate hydroxylase